MIRKKRENIEWLEFEQFQPFPHLVHGVFLRHGGVSEGAFSSLNVGLATGDSTEAVSQNRKRVAEILGVEALVGCNQVHGVQLETPDSMGENPCDGLLTRERDQGLMVLHADCQAALFFDPVENVIANVHCGWRGSVQNIYAKTVNTLEKRFSTRPENLLVCISPSLGPSAAEFVHHKKELPEHFIPFRISSTHFDFWEITKMQLMESGVIESHIEIARLCTFEDFGDFFSYRRDKKTGRHATVIALKQP